MAAKVTYNDAVDTEQYIQNNTHVVDTSRRETIAGLVPESIMKKNYLGKGNLRAHGSDPSTPGQARKRSNRSRKMKTHANKA